MLLPYVWLPPQVPPRTPWARFGVSPAWLALAIVHAVALGILSTAGMVAIAAFGLLCYAYWRQRSPPADAVLTTWM